jgi:hypothetical protein
MNHRNFKISKRLLGAALMATIFFAIGAGAPTIVRADATRWEGPLPALRIQVDGARNRAWVLNYDAVYLYDIPAGMLIKRIELPDWQNAGATFSCAPELALSPSGTALVTSNVLPTIWEIDPDTLETRQHNLSLDADADKDVGFTGLAFGRDGQDLVGVSSLLGSAWRIDLGTDEARKLPLSEPIHGACGL